MSIYSHMVNFQIVEMLLSVSTFMTGFQVVHKEEQESPLGVIVMLTVRIVMS